MAETLNAFGPYKRALGVAVRGPIKVVDASEVDYSAGLGRAAHRTEVVRRATMQVIFAGYTAVTVKAQRSLDGVTWDDIAGASITVTGDVVDFAVEAPHMRLHITATLSVGADTLEVWLYEENQSR